MHYLHTMVRISDIEASLRFYCELLGLEEHRRSDSEAGRYTLIFLCAPEAQALARCFPSRGELELGLRLTAGGRGRWTSKPSKQSA